MAVNTRSKRASVIGLGLGIALTLPMPDGTVGQADRQGVALSYSGIAAVFSVDGRILSFEAGYDITLSFEAGYDITRSLLASREG